MLQPLAAMLNRNIDASAAARRLCARLQGKSLRLQVSGLPWGVLLSATENSIDLTLDDTRTGDATLSGSALGFLNLATARSAATLQGSTVCIAGDAEVAQGFRDLLKYAQPDFEEELSRYVGDVAAHRLGRAAQKLLQFGERVGDTALRNLGEYVQEESRDVAHRVELEEFATAVDSLRDDVERAAARIEQLEKRNL